MAHKHWRKSSWAFAARLLLLFVLVFAERLPVYAAAAETPAWALSNDGTFTYEDNDASWYSGMETVHAVKGIDVNPLPAGKADGIYARECIVALLDTGVDITQPALLDGLWKNTGEIAGDGIDNDKNGYIDDVDGWNFYKDTNVVYNPRSSTEDAHGTHCAGTIIAHGVSGITGIAGGIDAVRLMPVKVVGGPDQSGTVENLIKGIRYAERNGAAICNISLAFEKWNEKLYQVMKKSNMLFVVAAGNGGSDTRGSGVDLAEFPRYPACYGLANVITVANLKCNGRLHYSSNYSAVHVDLAAPGTKIYGLSIADPDGEEMTGTSMAAPMASAVAALVYAGHKNWDIRQVRQALLDSVRRLEPLKGLVKTGGMLNIAGAMSCKGVLAAAKITGAVSGGKNQSVVKWKKVKGADRYEVIIAENKSFTKNKTVKRTEKTSLTLKRQKKGAYYVKVRACAGQGAGKSVGAYSPVYKYKVK